MALIGDHDDSNGNLRSSGTTGQTPDYNTFCQPGDQDDVQPTKQTSPWKTLSVLLLGVFISQVDSCLVLATYGNIASEFQALSLGSWIVSSFIIAQCAVQPLYGKLSDVYGRRSCLLAAYSFFIIGTLGVSLSRSLAEIFVWRSIQGVGGAGMVSLVSIIITDIVPKNDVASMRSYVNVLQTMGRSCGGAIGGLLTEAIGWRWAFFVQVPPMVVAVLLVARMLPQNERCRERQVDFAGAFFLTTTIVSICLVLDGYSIAFAVATVSGVAFLISTQLVGESIFPLRVLTPNVTANFLVTLLSLISQVSLMTYVPIYFQASANASVAIAGLYLVPAFVGNTLGALLAGYWIKQTGRYKTATVFGPVMALVCAGLVLTWNGKTGPAESLYTFFGGFAMGIVASSTFVGVIVGVDEIAIVASGMYLASNIGAISGVSAGSATARFMMEASLKGRLEKKMISEALSDLGYVWRTDPETREILIAAYTSGMHGVNYLGITCSIIALLFAISTTGLPLDQMSG